MPHHCTLQRSIMLYEDMFLCVDMPMVFVGMNMTESVPHDWMGHTFTYVRMYSTYGCDICPIITE